MGNTLNSRLSSEQIAGQLSGMTGWSYNAEHSRIERSFSRMNFLDAVAFIQQIAQVAEAKDHHPDLLLSGYKNVLVMLSTHSAGGVTNMDLDLARVIDTLPE